MATFKQLTDWSEKVIVWIFGPSVFLLFALFFAGFESLMIIPLGMLAVGVVALFVLYIWRLFAP
jgi:hypothetical protein